MSSFNKNPTKREGAGRVRNVICLAAIDLENNFHSLNSRFLLRNRGVAPDVGAIISALARLQPNGAMNVVTFPISGEPIAGPNALSQVYSEDSDGWMKYCAARAKAENSGDMRDGLVAGKAWSECKGIAFPISHRHIGCFSSKATEVWAKYLVARDQAEKFKDIRDGIVAGKAWREWLGLFLPENGAQR